MCRKVPLRRWVETTPAKDESSDSSPAALARTWRGSWATRAPCIWLASPASRGWTVSSESTNSR